MGDAAQTSIEAYQDLITTGKAETAMREIAIALTKRPMTAHELTEVEELGYTMATVTGRVNELLRRGCVKRVGRRENPSGHEAHVHELTNAGRTYVRTGDAPEPDPRLAELKTEVVDAAREYLRDEVDRATLAHAIVEHDTVKQRMDPDWEP